MGNPATGAEAATAGTASASIITIASAIDKNLFFITEYLHFFQEQDAPFNIAALITFNVVKRSLFISCWDSGFSASLLSAQRG